MERLKKLVIPLLGCLLMLMSIAPAFAAEGNVTYEGDAKEFIFEPGSEYSPTDLFTGQFKDMMPGDVAKEEIQIKNDSKKPVRIYMKSEGSVKGTEDFLKEFSLAVSYNGRGLQESPANETAGLTDWVLLGTYEPGAQGILNVELKAPITLSNEFSEKAGYINWKFKVEEVENAGKKIDKDDNATGGKSLIDRINPKTGDLFPVVKVILIIMVAAAAVTLCVTWMVVGKKKKANKEEEKDNE